MSGSIGGGCCCPFSCGIEGVILPSGVTIEATGEATISGIEDLCARVDASVEGAVLRTTPTSGKYLSCWNLRGWGPCNAGTALTVWFNAQEYAPLAVANSLFATPVLVRTELELELQASGAVCGVATECAWVGGYKVHWWVGGPAAQVGTKYLMMQGGTSSDSYPYPTSPVLPNGGAVQIQTALYAAYQLRRDGGACAECSAAPVFCPPGAPAFCNSFAVS